MRLLLSIFVLTFFIAWSAEAATWTVSGNQFYKNGTPWVPRGFEMLGATAPKLRSNPACLSPGIRDALNSWSVSKIQRAVNAPGVNTIEISVSMDGLDPASEIYDPNYAAVVTSAIQSIRETGAVAIVAMNGHRGDGYCPAWRVAYHPREAERAWKTLAPVLPADSGIMLRLYKEPSAFDVPCIAIRQCLDFERWASDYSDLIATVRSGAASGLAWKGIVIVDGLHNHYFPPTTAPRFWPIDQNRQIAYNCDCYLDAGDIAFTSVTAWNTYLSDVATHFPFLIGEFGVAPGTRLGRSIGCKRNAPVLVQSFFNWLRTNFDHKIGLIGWAYDRPSSIFVGTSTTPTTFDNFTNCAALGSDYRQGAGQMILDQIRRLSE